MEYRKLGNTDLNISVIAFGAWAAGGWMWGKTDRNDAIEAIKAAYNEGVTTIDTAPIYGQGESEEIVGDAIAGIPRDKIQILTKFGMRWDLSKGVLMMKTQNNSGEKIDVYKFAGKESVIKECENSLRRLKTDYIDLYQIHWPDTTTPVSETFEAVEKLIEQGKVRFAGVCNYDVKLLEEVSKTIDFTSDQIPFSIINRGVEKEIVPYCIKHRKSILAYSPLERGLLTGKMTQGYKFAEGDHRSSYYKGDIIVKTNEFLDKIRPLAEDKKVNLSQLVLQHTINVPGITCALAGARNAKQSVDNAKAANVPFSKADYEFIEQQLKDSKIQ
ncbi:MAG: aldo/keto reductase [Prevotellaceae bacterium]|jgi:aryl-alcohol dehydrogenase-like predicted oxidoreductase|nr:aldo/keto reductase [Prevotellaceae bacterium]